MRYHQMRWVLVAAALMGGCTTQADIPATAPTTMSRQPAATTTTTRQATTSTTVDRTAEIAAIFEDLERRRLEAIHAGDREAFSALFADTPYLEASLAVFDLADRTVPPEMSIQILEVLRDDGECLAIWSEAIVNGISSEAVTTVLQPTSSGWGFAFVSSRKGDWLCDTPHPLSPSP